MASPKPAELLTGMVLDGGWEVTQLLASAPGGTGGNFSVAYLVERESATAFLKALDLTFVMTVGTGSVVDRLAHATAAYRHERDIVLSCTDARMSNVVRALATGEVTVDQSRLDPSFQLFSDVPYLIFEKALGDVRSAIDNNLVAFDDAWSLRMLHGAANGVRQLHQAEMAHQDVKPSNLMAFEDIGKVGDLGRASPPGGNGLYDGHVFAGDKTYAPPELLYQEIQLDDRVRRRAADLYQVGSLIAFFFTRSGMTAMIEAELDVAFHWRNWPNDYRRALPFVRQAYDQAVLRIESQLPPACRAELVRCIREMCDPDPLVRGNPRVTRPGPQRYSLEQYVARFDRLAKTAELALRGKRP